jgi:hypothetical protein
MSAQVESGELEVREEYVNNEATGVEVEEDGPASPSKEPWDADKIKIHTKNYSLRQIMDMIEDREIDLAPDFQRKYVWKDWQRWALVESILLGIPMPSFYFNEDRDGKLQVVDGVQRLTTLRKFVKGEFALEGLTYLKVLEGNRFGDKALEGMYRRRFHGTQIVAHVIDPQTPLRLKFDVFKRINTGGSALSAQEIRHCMSLERSRDLLTRLVSLDVFKKVMGPAVLNHPRMADREIALRLIAFHVLPVEQYPNHDSLDGFLGAVTEKVDRAMSPEEISRVETLAKRSLENARLVFGEYTFRKWPKGEVRRNPINRTLVESWGTALAFVEPADVKRVAKDLCERARLMMTHPSPFFYAITGGTGDVEKVKTRMSMAADAVKALLP